MATSETGNNAVVWSDIEYWVGEGVSSDAIANTLNSDYRHFRDTTVEAVFEVIDSLCGVVTQNRGLEPDPANDDPRWQGQFDDYHRALPDAGDRNKLLRRAWNRLLKKGNNSPAVVPANDGTPTHEVDLTSRQQQGGFTLREWNEEVQQMVQASGGVYTGPLVGTPQELADQVNAFFNELTGGRRFGVVTEADIDAVIRRHDQEQAVADVTQRATNAIDAARQSFGNDNEPAQIVADGDAAYATPLP